MMLNKYKNHGKNKLGCQNFWLKLQEVWFGKIMKDVKEEEEKEKKKPVSNISPANICIMESHICIYEKGICNIN